MGFGDKSRLLVDTSGMLSLMRDLLLTEVGPSLGRILRG